MTHRHGTAEIDGWQEGPCPAHSAQAQLRFIVWQLHISGPCTALYAMQYSTDHSAWARVGRWGQLDPLQVLCADILSNVLDPDSGTQSSRPESQLRRKYGSRRTCRLYITFYTEKHTMHLLNQWCWDLEIYRVIQKGCPQLGGCKIGIFRSFWLVLGLFLFLKKTNQEDLKIPNLQPPDWGQPFWMTQYIPKFQHH